ncbi:MAG TPA: hypothetical protein VJT50_15865 [Pyrinomonadaceae bacterium]|nr:hypothetical protein [Pyrinomonadaceae bacterium]
MKPNTALRPLTRGEQEAETEATRLNELIEDALAIVAVRSTSDVDSLEAVTVRIERAARDLSVALRELAHERRIAQNSVE